MKVRKQTPPTVESRVTFYVDQRNQPSQKDENGAVQATDGLTGAPITLDEAATPATDSDGVWLYSKDVSGVSELFVKDGDGNEIQVTNNGVLNAGVGGTAARYFPSSELHSEFDTGETPILSPGGTSTFDTGLILTPTPGQASLWHFRGVMVFVIAGPDTLTNHFAGWVAFDDSVGTPDARIVAGSSAIAWYPAPWMQAHLNEADPAVTVLPTGEMQLNFNIPSSGDYWMRVSMSCTSFNLPANLIAPPPPPVP